MKKSKTSIAVFYRVDFFAHSDGTWQEAYTSPFNTLKDAKQCFRGHAVARITRVLQKITTTEKVIK